ncbi:hypothetical protein MMC27_002781 [Xylographa pallens]|nr:hypothetical protein [Xylographa pallens]
MRFVTLLLTIAIANFTVASCLISCNGFPLLAAQVASDIGNCRRAIAGIPIWSIDVGNAEGNGDGTIILHPNVQHYRVPASFDHSDQISGSSCEVQITVFRTQITNGQPHAFGGPIPLPAVALAFYVWNPAHHAAGRIVDECLRIGRRLGISTEILTIPPVSGLPETPIEINVAIKVESFAWHYHV